MYSIPNNNADDGEEINEACSEIDMLLCARESHVRFAQGLLHGSAEPTNSDKQSDGNEGPNIRENYRYSHDCENNGGVNKLTNKKKPQLVLRRHGSNDPSSATRLAGRVDCNQSAMAGFAAALC